MRILIIIITTCLICASCGVKDDPKYQSQIKSKNKINVFKK
jgi:hypothetical protein